ncbi:MAG: GNAT family N-acetyltransferase [Pyrinomonadaceae bacterium]
MASRAEPVSLRRPQPTDFDELARLYKASQTHFHGRASSDFDQSRFAKTLADSEWASNEYFLICNGDDSAIAGTINLSQIFFGGFQNAYLGYQLFAGFTGRGLMTEAVRQILEFAFADLGLHRVEANVQPGNFPSIRVLERSGFTREGFSRRYLKIAGRWRDHERWAIIREDWKKRKTNDSCPGDR